MESDLASNQHHPLRVIRPYRTVMRRHGEPRGDAVFKAGVENGQYGDTCQQ